MPLDMQRATCGACGEAVYRPGPDAPWRTIYVTAADTTVCDATGEDRLPHQPCSQGHKPGEHDASCVPPADPRDPALRLLRAIFGLCAVCDDTSDHEHSQEEYDRLTGATPRITADQAGCWLDGHMGWHNTYRVIELARDYGWKPDDAPLVGHAVEVYKQTSVFTDVMTYPGDVDWACDVIHDIADEATDYLQGLAPEGYWFEWDMGELCLVRDDEDDGYDPFTDPPDGAHTAAAYEAELARGDM